MEVDFVVYGELRGKGRPRFGNGRTYTPKTTSDYENNVLAAYMDKYHTLKLKGQIWCQIRAFKAIPKSAPKKYVNDMIGTGCQTKPDIDNIAKIILDGLNGIAFDDDKQIVCLQVEKKYGVESKVEVKLREV